MADLLKTLALAQTLVPNAVPSAVEGWLDNHPEATTTVEDGSITEAKLASALATKVAQITQQSEEIAEFGITSVNALERHYGMINSTGNWANLNAKYQHVIIPINPGDTIEAAPNASNNTYIGVLTNYTEPVNGAAIPLSAQTGFTGRISLNTNLVITAPSDAKYLIYLLINNDHDASPSKLKINGYDYSKAFITNYMNDTEEFRDGINADLETYYDGVNELLPLSKKQKWQALPGAGGTWQSVGNSAYEFSLIPIHGGETYIIKTQESYSTIWAVLTSFAQPVQDTSIPFSAETGWTARRQTNADSIETGTFPSDGRYVLIETKNGNVDNSPTHFLIDDIDHIKNVYGNIRNVINRHINWCSMGDSIAYGTRSYMNGDTPAIRNDPDLGWACGVSEKNYYTWTNICEPGGGYLYDDGGRSAAYTIARNTDYTQFDLVTLAYGLNDWKGHKLLGTVDDDASAVTPTTTLQAMKATIEAIMTSNPFCKIIVITPLNSSHFGTYADNYALGYEDATSGKTLEDFVQGIISVCNLYGLQYIDNAHESVVNRLNITSLLLDGVHPTKEAHALIANEMAAKITNK